MKFKMADDFFDILAYEKSERWGSYHFKNKLMYMQAILEKIFVLSQFFIIAVVLEEFSFFDVSEFFIFT